MRPYKSFVLPFSCIFLVETQAPCCVFQWQGVGGGSEMKGRVIYKYIKNECIYEVLFSSHSPLAIVATLYPSVFAYKAPRIPSENRIYSF